MVNIIDYLQNRVQKSIRVDIKDVALFHSRRERGKRGGFFGVPRAAFCHVNFLGKLAYDLPGDTQPGEQFIKDFFPSNYHNYSELIYSMYRHGTVHELVPKAFFSQNPNHRPKRICIKWLINNSNKRGNRAANMKFFPMHGKRATLFLAINTCQLADDLMFAFSEFVKKLKSDRQYQRGCQRRLEKTLKVKNADLETSIGGVTRRREISKQFLLAWKNRSEQIDEKGRTFKKV